MQKAIQLLVVDVTSNPTAVIIELEQQDDPFSLSSRTKAANAITAELERLGQLPSRAGFEAEARFVEVLEAEAPPSLNALHGRIHGGFYAVKTNRPPQTEMEALAAEIAAIREQLEGEKLARKEQAKTLLEEQAKTLLEEHAKKLEELKEELADKWKQEKAARTKLAAATSEIEAAVLKIKQVYDPLNHLA